MNWFELADYAQAKKCRERATTGTCSCQRRRGIGNPCDDHEAAREAATDLGLGYTPALSVEELVAWLAKYQCRDSRAGYCDHPACKKVRQLLNEIGNTRRIAA